MISLMKPQMRSPMRVATAALAMAVVASLAADALAQSGLQISPDGKRTLISKDVGSQRWAITLNADDGTVTGNVFAAGGGRPSFVWCSETNRDGGNITFACSGADPCPLAPCPTADEWDFIAEASLPTSFFQPRQETSADAAEVRAEAPDGHVQGGGAQRQSGVQPSVDGKRILISKDVGDQRWVIVWNEDDGTLTGNVFFPGGGDPQFVWCIRRGQDGGQIQFTCHGADRCAAPPCTRDAWSKIADVVLPVTFLEPSSQIASNELADSITETFGSQDAGFRAVLLASDRGYSVRQITRAALSSRLGANGVIAAKSGGTEVPENEPTNDLAANAGTSADLASPAQDSELIQAVCDTFRDSLPPDQKLETLTRLLARGYTASQIIQVVRGQASIQLCDGAPTPAEFRACVEANGGKSVGLIGPGGPIDPGESTEEVILEPAPPGACDRNGRWEPGEDCDGGDLNGQSCTSLRDSPFIGGPLRCDSECRFDVSGCRARSVCGDGERDLDEDCDGTDLGGATCETLGALFPRGGPGFTGGVLECSNNPDGQCVYVIERCLNEPECGNGRVEQGEDCDIGQLRGATCTNLQNFAPPGINFPGFAGGTVGCNSAPGQDCRFDLSDCRAAGNSVCGDGELDPDEDCDIGEFGNRTCVTEGFAGGDLECVLPSDGSRCQISIEDCRRTVDAVCGDGKRDSGEVCDNDDVGGKTCITEGFVSGELSCFIPSDPTQPCRLVTEGCRDRAECNNGVAEGDASDEECDGRDFRGVTCARLGIGDARGTLECSVNCTIDRDASCKQAQTCLNNIAEGTEDCDREDLRGRDCTDEGFDLGTLKCGNDCVYDVSECERGCGLGEQTCPDGSCVPPGSDCCGNRQFCQPGTVCAGQGACCPAGLPEACGTSSCMPAGADCCDASGAFCSPGSRCTNEESCCPADFPQPCDGNCIRAGAVCCDGKACAAGGSCCGGTCIGPGDQCCGGTNACGSGGTCCGAGCVPVGSDCCQAGVACAPGMVCTSIFGVCCPTNAPIPCAADMTCRPVGSSCP